MRIDEQAFKGTHGLTAREYRENAHGIFYAQGPQLKIGLTIAFIDNINIYHSFVRF